MKTCINCDKTIPNYRQERAKTCSLECSHDWNHLSIKQREEKFKLFNKEVLEE